MAQKIKHYSKSSLILALILILTGIYYTIPAAQAVGEISSRSMQLSDSRPEPDGTAVTYTFTGTHSVTEVNCLRIQYCDAASGACVKPTGMVTTTATKEADWTGWDEDNWTLAAGTDGETKYTSVTGRAGGSARTIITGTITNPTAAATIYVKVTTYTNVNCSTGATDTGTVAVAIVAGVAVTATVSESLSFGANDYALDFGTWAATELRYATEAAGGTETEGSGGTLLTLTTNTSGATTVWIKDIGDTSSLGGLYKAAGTPKLIAAADAYDVEIDNTEQYGVYGSDGSSFTVDEAFDKDITGGAAISRTLNEFGTTSGAVTATVKLKMVADIVGTTPAGSYADTIILVATPVY